MSRQNSNSVRFVGSAKASELSASRPSSGSLIVIKREVAGPMGDHLHIYNNILESQDGEPLIFCHGGSVGKTSSSPATLITTVGADTRSSGALRHPGRQPRFLRQLYSKKGRTATSDRMSISKYRFVAEPARALDGSSATLLGPRRLIKVTTTLGVTGLMPKPFRTTVTGSYPRPVQTANTLKKPSLSRREADEVIRWAVKEQVELGLDIVADGEGRRENMYYFVQKRVDGLSFDQMEYRRPQQPICLSQSWSGTAPLEDHQLLAKGHERCRAEAEGESAIQISQT